MAAYAFGQELTQDQRVFVKDMRKLFRESGYQVPELMRAIASREEFYQAAPLRPSGEPPMRMAAIGK
jgi:hypothetical protein